MYMGWIFEFGIKCMNVNTVYKLCKNLKCRVDNHVNTMCDSTNFFVVTKTSEGQNMTMRFIVG